MRHAIGSKRLQFGHTQLHGMVAKNISDHVVQLGLLPLQ